MKILSALLFLLLFPIPAFSAQKATLEKVVDGDTIKVVRDGKKETVRLIGVDTPESKKNKKAKRDVIRSKKDIDTITELGKESARHTRKLLKNKKEVYIETDVQEKDRYGRTLGYVYMDKKKKKMLNKKIIEDGYGTMMTVPPNVKHVKEFQKAQEKARKPKKQKKKKKKPAPDTDKTSRIVPTFLL